MFVSKCKEMACYTFSRLDCHFAYFSLKYRQIIRLFKGALWQTGMANILALMQNMAKERTSQKNYSVYSN